MISDEFPLTVLHKLLRKGQEGSFESAAACQGMLA
jgi:hypothetical protein